jgi:dolichol-phosphate mannosyltransferase
MTPGIALSVVIPVRNEAGVVGALVDRLFPMLAALGEPWEMIVVDDGSTDDTWERLRAVRAGHPQVRLLRFSRNFGQQAAITAGLDQARGAAVVVMDADLQDPPELIPEFVRLWRAGSEIVYGVRATRQETFARRALYRIFYRLLSRLSAREIPRDAGDFCLMDRRVVDVLKRMPERNRFLRGLRSWVGFRSVGVPYDRPRRAAGQPAYSFPGLIGLALDGIASFSYVPLRISAVVGALVALAGVLVAVWAAVARMVMTVPNIPSGWASVIVLVCVIGGTQLVALGVIGEYLARVYDEVKQRPTYVVRDVEG